MLEIDREKQRAIVEKLMVFKRHYKRGRNPAAPEGGIVEKNGSIHLSNLALIDPESKKPTRVGFFDSGSMSARFERWMLPFFSTMPPSGAAGFRPRL